MNPDILIVGAGPTGLVMALRLLKHNVSFRIIDKNSGHGEASRALVLHARTMEFYRQLGFGDEISELGIKLESLHIREGSREKAHLTFKDLGEDLSPYPYMLSYPQDDHEQFLGEKLKRAGIEIEWNTELLSFEDKGDYVEAVLSKDGHETSLRTAYLCGCDGAHSPVRKTLGLGFSGGTYDKLFYVADVEAETLHDASMNLYLDAEGFCAYMPVRSSGMVRVIGIIPEKLAQAEHITFSSISGFVKEKVGLDVKKENWFSTYKVHHRVSDHFRKGRVFIAGDAGHLHSPAGGQGMNTGIGDAVNLSWKLAEVLKEKAHPDILDTYETERITFARTLVDTTDKAFQNIVGETFKSKVIRTVIMPYIAPFLLGFSTTRKAAFKVISQTRIHYHDSRLSKGTSGKITGGDRLPYYQNGPMDNYDPLTSCEWQIHIYGKASEQLGKFKEESGAELHVFPWESPMEEKGLMENAIYLIRPDGYIAYTNQDQDLNSLKNYLQSYSLRFK
ncbi:FAD-dependent monooxygenase [Rossellomorea sp. KS-H15a]|uniref:FAD-dependent monooxygenase n=1 Tax=Rossellomorea sp. KS-H15a TaxID=2963940 RepID=UPI0020C6A119|nr:FAD-dependent monooxygenase [Rossellomorea sp. KS-H15a]UTE76787.1 FAD-dependent monooxygenase [Rossellomorea sp. KS-H15a]